jgi:hypothetical protein
MDSANDASFTLLLKLIFNENVTMKKILAARLLTLTAIALTPLKLLPILLISLYPHVSFAEETITDKEINAAIERMNQRVEMLKSASIKIQDDSYPKLRRMSLDYTKVDGNIFDNSESAFFGVPNAKGPRDAKSWRLGVGVQIDPDWNVGLGISTSDGDSNIRQGTPGTFTTNKSSSDSNGISGVVRYQIKDWLSAGIFGGISTGDVSSTNTAAPPQSGSSTFRSHSKGIFLSGVHALSDELVLAVSPSYVHVKNVSKFDNVVAGNLKATTTNVVWNLDHNLSYFFMKQNLRVTAGYTHHWNALETKQGSNAPRDKYWGTGYIGATWMNKDGIEVYGNVGRDFSDAVYDDSKTWTIGIAKSWR